MLYLLLVVATVFCAYQVMRSQRLLVATLWLAMTSALCAIILYALGAPEVAVIELSVGAGLVTVLFVFAFSIIGEHTLDELTLVPRPLVWGLILAVSFLLGWFTLPLSTRPTGSEIPFAQVLWQQRGLDVLAQIVMIFGAVMGLMGLLADSRHETRSEAIQSITNSNIPADSLWPVKTNGHKPQSEPAIEETHA